MIVRILKEMLRSSEGSFDWNVIPKPKVKNTFDDFLGAWDEPETEEDEEEYGDDEKRDEGKKKAAKPKRKKVKSATEVHSEDDAKKWPHPDGACDRCSHAGVPCKLSSSSHTACARCQGYKIKCSNSKNKGVVDGEDAPMTVKRRFNAMRGEMIAMEERIHAEYIWKQDLEGLTGNLETAINTFVDDINKQMQYFTLPGLFHMECMEWGVDCRNSRWIPWNGGWIPWNGGWIPYFWWMDSMEWGMDSMVFPHGFHDFPDGFHGLS